MTRGQGQGKRQAWTRDARPLAIALVVGVVIAGGLAIAYWPATHGTPVADGAVHAQEKAEAEINQRFEQGVAMLNAKEYENALHAFHRVLELAPDMPEAHVNAGFALLGLERYAVARDFFKGAIALRKNQLNAYYGLAVALAGTNDLPGADEAMRTYLHLSLPDDPYRAKALAATAVWEAELTRLGYMHSPASALK